MKKKQLESFLQQLETFDRPRLDLEQYATSPQLGSSILEAINEDVGLNEDTLLADLGCGSGILMIGAARIGAGLSVGFDVDQKALFICQENIQESGFQEICELLQVDVCACSPNNMRALSRFEGKFDVVVMNPPFGTKNNSGTDVKFIEVGLALLRQGGSLYSLHKSSTRKFLLNKSKSEWLRVCAVGEVKAQLRWDLAKTYKHQKMQNVDIDVDLFRFVKA